MLKNNRGGDVPSRNSKRNERSRLTRSSMKNKRTYLTRSSTKNKTARDEGETSSKKNKPTYLTRSSLKNKTGCNGETSELLASGDLHQESNKDVWSELSEEVASNLSKSVVSLVVADEHKVLFACSGVAIDCDGDATRFMTSASLVKALNDKRKDHYNLKIEVRNEDHVVVGFLREYDFKDNTATVIVKNFPDLRAVGFNDVFKFQPHGKVLALGRDVSGKLIATGGILTDDPISEDKPMSSTCKISKVCEGGPLFDFDGDFLGMNLSSSSKKTSFLPKFEVFNIFVDYESLDEMEFPALDSSKADRVGEVSLAEMSFSCKEAVNKHKSQDLEFWGYPKPPESMLNDEIILVDIFEEPFGDIYGTGVWSGISQQVASNIHDNIVALASFIGGKRFFACTGLFIEWNGRITILTSASLIRDSSCEYKIVENLRIQVLRPNEQRADGTLEHYNLHYNIALISVKDFCPAEPVKIQYRGSGSFRLLAVGCIFRSGRLMAKKGELSPMPVSYDCEYLQYCTCKISKAGIGGPLLDFDGKFVGMNFYDKYAGGTPYLPWEEIYDVLEYFKGKRTVAEGGYDVSPSRHLDWTLPGDASKFCNRWSLITPCWCRPEDLARLELENYRRRPQYVLL